MYINVLDRKIMVYVKTVTLNDFLNLILNTMWTSRQNKISSLYISFCLELVRDGFGEEKYFHLFVAELNNDPPGEYKTTLHKFFLYLF